MNTYLNILQRLIGVDPIYPNFNFKTVDISIIAISQIFIFLVSIFAVTLSKSVLPSNTPSKTSFTFFFILSGVILLTLL